MHHTYMQPYATLNNINHIHTIVYIQCSNQPTHTTPNNNNNLVKDDY